MWRVVLRLFFIHPALSISLVFIGVALVVFAVYGLGNTWRMLRRGGSARGPHSVDLGWGGALGHYTEADEDPFGMPPGGG